MIFRNVGLYIVRKYVIALRHLQLSLGIHGNTQQPHHFWGFKKINTFDWPETVYAQTSSCDTAYERYSEYFQNITQLNRPCFMITMVTNKFSKSDILCETVVCQFP